MTPDKINAVAIIKRLLDKIGQRQVQLEELWKERKNSLEQSIQLQGFEKSVQKVRGWLRTRGDDMLAVQTDIGMSIESVQSLLDQHEKVEAKARVSGWGQEEMGLARGRGQEGGASQGEGTGRVGDNPRCLVLVPV